MRAWNPREFTLRGPDDFVRLDGLCSELLGDFFAWLQSPEGGSLEPAEASPLAHDADRYLRDFVVDAQETGPSDPDSDLPLRYVANWYIVNTLEPTHARIDAVLTALRHLYRYLAAAGVLEEEDAREAARVLADGEMFHRRLEDFWNLTPEAIFAWRTVADYRKPRRGAPQKGRP